MAFWALGKVKNLATGIVNVKQVGSKLKNYYAHPKKIQQQQSSTLSSKPRQKMSQAQLMQLQLQSYRKLIALQQQILAEQQQNQMKKLQQTQQYLMKLHSQISQQTQENKKKQAMGKLISEVQSGNKDLKTIIQENINMRQQLEKRKVDKQLDH